jgi:hypothetical protein
MRGIAIAILTLIFQSGQDLYQQALVQERAAGNPEAAIQLYKDAARNAGGDRALAAQALLGAARCYELLGQTKAQEIYEDIVHNYPDQQQQAAIARDRAAALHGTVQVFAATGPDGTFQKEVIWRRDRSPDNLVSVGPGMFWRALPRFDRTKPITVTGTLSRMEWVNPSVMMEIATSDGLGASYRIFGSNPSRLLQLGLNRNLLKLGDVITVEGFSGDEPNTIGQATITLPDGRKFELGGSVSGAGPAQRWYQR